MCPSHQPNPAPSLRVPPVNPRLFPAKLRHQDLASRMYLKSHPTALQYHKMRPNLHQLNALLKSLQP